MHPHLEIVDVRSVGSLGLDMIYKLRSPFPLQRDHCGGRSRFEKQQDQLAGRAALTPSLVEGELETRLVPLTRLLLSEGQGQSERR